MARIIKLEPFISTKIWGYEKWNLSTHRNGYSLVYGKKQSLIDVINKDIPIIIKIIKAKETLSVQVHPDDNFAKKYENDNGKTECWYILEATEGAGVICGLKKKFDSDSLRITINNDKIEDYLNHINVNKGDMIYIPSGTIHAIEGGIKLIEVQQSSDITYRIYDWGRDRTMHIEKALQVIDYNQNKGAGKIEKFHRLDTTNFSVQKINVDGVYYDKSVGGFHSYTVISGKGLICSGIERAGLKAEDSVYIKSNVKYKIKGKVELLKVWEFFR